MALKKKPNYAAVINDNGLTQHTGYGSAPHTQFPTIARETTAIGDTLSGRTGTTPTQAGASNPATRPGTSLPTVGTDVQANYGALIRNGGNGGGDGGDGGESGSTDTTSKYDYLKDAAATELLSAGTQATIAEQIARKNLAIDLQRQGLANSGYLGTASALISNAGANQMAQANTAYTEAMRQIEQQELEEADQILAASADNITANIGNLSKENRDSYLTSKGLVYNEKTGKWENGDGTNFTDAMLEGINDAYAIAGYNTASGYDIESLGSLSTGTNYGTIGEAFGNEYRLLTADLQKGNLDDLEDGTIIVLQRGDNGGVQYYLRYEDGQFVPVSDSDYNAYEGDIITYSNDGKTKSTKGTTNNDGKVESGVTVVGKTENGQNIYEEVGYDENGKAIAYYRYYIDPSTGNKVGLSTRPYSGA